MAYYRKRGCKCKDKRKCNCGATWSFTVDVGRDANGKRIQKTESGFKTKPEAVAAAAAVVTAYTNGSIAKMSEKGTVGDYMRDFLGEVLIHDIEVNTMEGKQGILENHVMPELGKLKMKKTTHMDIQRFANRLTTEKNLSPGTVRNIMRLVNQTFEHATTVGDINKNIVSHVKKPTYKKKKHNVWSKDQWDIFLDAVEDSWYYPLYIIALNTGLRPSELTALDWDHVDLKNGEVYVENNTVYTKAKGIHIKPTPKNDSSKRKVSIPQFLVTYLKKLKLSQPKNKYNLVAPSMSLKIIYNATFGDALKADCIRAGVPVLTPHELRHTHATYLLTPEKYGGLGFGLKAVSERLGHANPTITLDTYSHALENMQGAVAEALNNVGKKEIK